MRHLITLLMFTHILSGQTWQQIADFPGLERDDGVAINVNDKLYFGSGLTVGWALSKDFYVLDPSTNAWSTITSMPDGTQRQYACVFAATGSFFVFGGAGVNGASNELFQYNISSGIWSSLASKPGSGLYGAQCFQFADKIIIMGGKGSVNNLAVNEVWEYSISSNTWLQKNNFPFGGRFRASATVLHNTGYLMFGLDQNDVYRKEMYVYNQNNDTWSKILDFPQPFGRAYASLQAVGGKLALFGGIDSLNVYHKDLWYFDPGTSIWSQQADFPSFGRKGGMSAIVREKFYYTCGIGVLATEARLKETWQLDIPVGIIENHQNNLFSIYPNPCNSVLNINTGEMITEILFYSLSDVYGREIKNFSSTEKKINIYDLDSGIYFLKIKTEKGNAVVCRFVKE